MTPRHQIGIIGDHAHVEGGIHHHSHNVQQFYQTSSQEKVDEATLTKALHRLEQMPLDEIPEPANLAAGSRIPFVTNPFFVGRKEDLQWLAQTLKEGRTAAVGQVAAATGLGGIGKTQLAVEFVHRYGQFFKGGVHWVNFSDPAAIPTEIVACCVPGQGGFDIEEQIRLVLSAWQSPLPRLLVFDNCEDEQLLRQWRPKTGGSRVLATSRIGAWDDTLRVAARPLGVLSRPESIALLKKHRPEMSDDDATAVAEELGNLPLALHLAGSFLKIYRESPEEYLRQLRDTSLLDHPSLQGRGLKSSPTDHTSHVGRTFAMSYDRLDPKDAKDRMAISLLNRAACFAPGIPIPRELLLKTLHSTGIHRLSGVSALFVCLRDLALTVFGRTKEHRAIDASDACNRLVDLGLLKREAEGSLVLHRLVALYIGEATEARGAVEDTLYEEAGLVNESGVPTPLVVWQAHLRWITDRASGRLDMQAACLCNQLGFYLDTVADYQGTRPYYERALAICDRVLGPNHPDTAVNLGNLGCLLHSMGDYQGARPYYERALAIKEKVLGREHPDTALSLNHMGRLLRSMGDYKGARPYYERALAIKEKVLGREHPDTALSLNHMGRLLRSMGDYKGARPYHERALAITEQVLGPEHPDTALSLNNMGHLLHSMGDDKGARPYYERALAINEQVLGPEHPGTAQQLNNFGHLLDSLGDYQGARPYYERALAVFEKALGPQHPNTQTAKRNLDALVSASKR